MPETFAPCATHPDALASFACDGCGKDLCYDCVDEGRLVVCRLCGEQAHPLDAGGPSGAVAAPVDDDLPEILYRQPTPEAQASSPARWFDDPFVAVVHHGVVPTATIAMVTALLWFLVDVRSVLLAGSGALKWLGLCFVTATVLIARYGKISGAQDRQGCYTVALGGATLAAITVAPWENAASGPEDFVANALTLVVVWKFASAVTRGLSLEDEAAERRGRRLYGLERVAFERARARSQGLSRPPSRGSSTSSRKSGTTAKQKSQSKAARPGSAVARLVVVGLVIFALGESVLLAGTSSVVLKARVDMVLFLLAAGVVLAASSGVETLRTVRRRGGRIAATTIPGRVVAGGLAMVVLIAVALAMPGLTTQGRGERLGSGANPGSWDVDSDRGRSTSNDGSPDTGLADSDATGEPPPPAAQGDRQRTDRASQRSASGVGGILDLLANLGRWLRWPLIAVLVLGGAFGLVRLWPMFRLWTTDLGGRWRAWWQGLRRRLSGGSRTTARQRPSDPWQGVGEIATLPPREAVAEAYVRCLEGLALAGFERDPQWTPNELLAKARRWRGALEAPLGQLTELYVDAAYGDGQTSADQRRRALAALDQLRQQLQPLAERRAA